ncbi:DNA-binding protein Ewg-like [Diabrotica undecimpunctata]|uniref:DNA-binding protein Ewg-like n=1 Tax=Diabrotica undecimpunctata TaxID=50387 RepID=UPI003B633B2A
MVLIMNQLNGNQNAEPEPISIVVGSPDWTTVASDDNDDCVSLGSAHDEGSDLITAIMKDEVTTQLAAAGPVGVAAATAIVSSKKRKMPHSFETDPSIRKRKTTRLLRKLRKTMDEFTTVGGKQAIILVATPDRYQVFGAKPLQDIIKDLRGNIMDQLGDALATQAPPPILQDPTLFKLPPLVIEGIPTPLAKMSQAMLRAFIPLMLKYSTGRGKPGWGKESMKPLWWPEEVPWANVRLDVRKEDEKQKTPWSHVLRQIVLNCYKFHGREDLLPAFTEEDEKVNQATTANADDTMQCTPTILHTITNSDDIYTTVQVDPNKPINTLPDSTIANFPGMVMGDGNLVHNVQTITEGGAIGEDIDFNSVTEATLNSEGQIILTEEDGHVSGVIDRFATVYQSMVAKIRALHTNGDGTIFVNHVFEVSKEQSKALKQ